MSDKYKCPYCGNEYPMKHLLVNHIRQSSGDHGEKYHLPDDYKERMGKKRPHEDQEAPANNGDQGTPAEHTETAEKPNITTDTKVVKVDPPEIQVVKDHKCPDCGTPKTEWINTKEAFKHEINLSYDEISEFDYVCPKCYELIKVK